MSAIFLIVGIVFPFRLTRRSPEETSPGRLLIRREASSSGPGFHRECLDRNYQLPSKRTPDGYYKRPRTCSPEISITVSAKGFATEVRKANLLPWGRSSQLTLPLASRVGPHTVVGSPHEASLPVQLASSDISAVVNAKPTSVNCRSTVGVGPEPSQALQLESIQSRTHTTFASGRGSWHRGFGQQLNHLRPRAAAEQLPLWTVSSSNDYANGVPW